MSFWHTIKNLFKNHHKERDSIGSNEIQKSFILGQEKQKKDEEKKATEEIQDRARIYELWKNNSTFNEYLVEANKFNKIYGKNVRCDICGWNCGIDCDLSNYGGQTYCDQHIPASYQITHERKVTAGRHGTARNYIKK